MDKLTIIKASPAQRKVAILNHYEEWGKGRYTKDQYFTRLNSLADPTAPWNKRGHTSWALVPRSDPETEDILASCDTFSNVAMVLPPDGKPYDTVTYGVAAVCTPVQNRGKGYARHMLQLLHYLLASPEHLPPFPKEWGTPPDEALRLPPGRFSTLQSGVGDTFYAKCRKGLGDESEPGWAWQNMPSRVWSLDPNRVKNSEVEGLTWLDRDKIAEYEVEATRRIRRDLEKIGDGSKTRVAVLPDPGWFNVHVNRYDRLQCPRKGATFGVVRPAKDGEEPAFMVYTFKALTNDPVNPPERMVIHHLSGDVPWSVVVAAADREGVDNVERWGYDESWDEECGGPAKSIVGSSMAQYGFGGDDKIEWEWQDNYVWC